jgi:hypothetical protein
MQLPVRTHLRRGRPPGLDPATNAEVPFIGSTPTNAAPSAACNPEGASDNAPEFNTSHLSAITADGVHNESHCSAISADSVHEPQLPQLHLHCPDSEPKRSVTHNNPKLAQGRCSVPPVVHPKISYTSHDGLSYEIPPCVAAVVVDDCSFYSWSFNANNPVEHKCYVV